MAYDASAPPLPVSPSRDGATPALWAYTTSDAVSTVTGDDYFSNAQNLGMRVGDFVVIAESDNAYAPVMGTVASISSGAATVTAASGQTMAPGSGIDGIAETYAASVERSGDLVYTRIVIDLTGLNSSAAGDIIGDDGEANCHIGQITAALNGTIVAGRMSCLETPAGGEPDIDLHAADEATGTEDAAVSGLTNTELLAAAADWTGNLASKGLTALPAADQYLYLVGDGAGTNATYTAGKLLIELWGT